MNISHNLNLNISSSYFVKLTLFARVNCLGDRLCSFRMKNLFKIYSV